MVSLSDCPIPASRDAPSASDHSASAAGLWWSVSIVRTDTGLTPARVEVPTAGERVTRINGIGEQSELQARAGKVSVGLKKGAPVYLIVGTTDE